MERSYVTTLFGLRVYLHRFVACDEDGVHDHPFRYSFSFILAGWYFEDRWSCRRKKRWFNFIGPDCFHRVVLPQHAQHDVWTLFIHTARTKQWGALRPVAKGQHGPILRYEPQSEPADPAFSEWHKIAPTGKMLRANPKLNIGSRPAFSVPLGRNAYASGLVPYPVSAERHSLDIDQSTLPVEQSRSVEPSPQMG
jgi:hypothetical protein